MNGTWWRAVTAAVAIAWTGSAGAQVLDLQTLRSANLAQDARISVDGGLAAGHTDYIGARGTFRFGERWAAGLDLGSADISGYKLTPGAFAMYQLDVDSPFPIAVKAGYRKVLYSDVEYAEFDAEVLASGAINDRIEWVAHAGFVRPTIEIKRLDLGRWGTIDVEDTEIDDLAPAIGGGVVIRLSDQAAAFAGIDALLGDIPGYRDTYVGAGIRWSFH